MKVRFRTEKIEDDGEPLRKMIVPPGPAAGRPEDMLRAKRHSFLLSGPPTFSVFSVRNLAFHGVVP
jgi:hypothetical protein